MGVASVPRYQILDASLQQSMMELRGVNAGGVSRARGSLSKGKSRSRGHRIEAAPLLRNMKCLHKIYISPISKVSLHYTYNRLHKHDISHDQKGRERTSVCYW